MQEEVAMFIDLENFRYSMLNNHGQEPDISQLVEKAKKYGRPSVMKAYADFTEHPSDLTRLLQVAGIEAINVPVKRTEFTRSGTTVERVKNAADMVLALDAVIEALEADRDAKQKVFLVVSGDRDYVKLVTLLRNRFGQRVVIAGVPGCVAGDLVKAAGEDDPVEVHTSPPVDKNVLKCAIVAMIKRGPSPLRYWSLKLIDQWTQDARQDIPGIAKERRDVIGELVDDGILVREVIDDVKRGKVTQIVLAEELARERGYLPEL